MGRQVWVLAWWSLVLSWYTLSAWDVTGSEANLISQRAELSWISIVETLTRCSVGCQFWPRHPTCWSYRVTKWGWRLRTKTVRVWTTIDTWGSTLAGQVVALRGRWYHLSSVRWNRRCGSLGWISCLAVPWLGSRRSSFDYLLVPVLQSQIGTYWCWRVVWYSLSPATSILDSHLSLLLFKVIIIDGLDILCLQLYRAFWRSQACFPIRCS